MPRSSDRTFIDSSPPHPRARRPRSVHAAVGRARRAWGADGRRGPSNFQLADATSAQEPQSAGAGLLNASRVARSGVKRPPRAGTSTIDAPERERARKPINHSGLSSSRRGPQRRWPWPSQFPTASGRRRGHASSPRRRPAFGVSVFERSCGPLLLLLRASPVRSGRRGLAAAGG